MTVTNEWRADEAEAAAPRLHAGGRWAEMTVTNRRRAGEAGTSRPQSASAARGGGAQVTVIAGGGARCARERAQVTVIAGGGVRCARGRAEMTVTTRWRADVAGAVTPAVGTCGRR